MKSALIIGAGLAGLVAARTLARSGQVQTLVLEARPLLGGKAASWRDADNALVEAGLHVCFPYYHHLLRLLDELGASHRIGWTAPAFNYLQPGAALAQLRFPSLPAPLHGAVAIARFGHLGLRDRLSAIVGAAEATLSGAGWRQRYESISFADWARQRGLSPTLLATVFEPMVGGLTFLRADQVSARAMLDYIHAIGSHAGHCRTGLFRAGSGEVIIEPLAADVRRHGGVIQPNSTVATLLLRAGRVVGVQEADGQQHHADLVIAAVPSHHLPRLLPAALLGNPALHQAGRLQPVPVVSVLLRLDRLVGGPAGVRFSPGCVFNTWVDMAVLLPELAGSGRSVLQLVVAPLGALAQLDDAALVARVLADLRRVLPAARAARLVSAVVTRTPRAFHAVLPGADALRPPTDPGIPGLLLAGDHVGAGRNPNMESAVHSGLQAAQAALLALA